jgi:hypothetical protein
MTNTITQLPIDTVKELQGVAKRFVDEYIFLSKITIASYDEPETDQDKDAKLYDEGETLFISAMTGLNLTLNNSKTLAWIKNCQDKYLEHFKKAESSKLEIDCLNCAFWKRKKNHAEVQYARTQILYTAMHKEAPNNWSKQWGSSVSNKKIMTESAHADMMRYLSQ